MVVYTLNWCRSTSAVHDWFWLKLLNCMVQFSLVPMFSVGGEKKSTASTVCACTYFPEIENYRFISVQPWCYNVYLPLHHLHIFWPWRNSLIIRTPARFSALQRIGTSDTSLKTVQVASSLEVCWWIMLLGWAWVSPTLAGQKCVCVYVRMFVLACGHTYIKWAHSNISRRSICAWSMLCWLLSKCSVNWSKNTHGNLLVVCASSGHQWQATHRQYKYHIE